MTSPANNVVLPAGSNLEIQYDASSTSSVIAGVTLYNGTNVVATGGSGGVSQFVLNGIAAGNYSFTVVATDQNGETSTSNAVNVNVVNVPAVALISPANNAAYVVPASIMLTANASENGGTITRVDFYNGPTLLGTATQIPYIYKWNNVAIGTYSLTAVATDNNGQKSTSPVITVAVDSTPVAPIITGQPTSQTVTEPANATFSVTAVGIPTPTYQWMQESPGAGSFTAIAGATGASYTTPATIIANSGTEYQCAVTNSAGTVTSVTVALTVNPTPVVPVITTQPADVTVITPATATFMVAATGIPTPTYQWMQEVTGATSYTPIAGATNASYTTPATTTVNSGTQYECVVTNMAGSATSAAATLTVSATPIAPTITTQPANTTVIAPATATFTVVATGVPAPTYQWQQEAPGATTYSTIDGATSASYTTSPTTIAESGTQYECIVTNVVNSVTSAPATLTANLAPTVAIVSPVQGTFSAASVNITAIATESGGGVANVTFYDGPTALGTITSTSQAFTYTLLNASGVHNISAVATDNAGTETRSSPITITIQQLPGGINIIDNVTSKTDALNHTTTYQYDNSNRLLQTTFADGSTVVYGYDPFGNQISVKDQRNNTLTKIYDAYERLFQTKDPNKGVTQYNYDAQSNLLTLTDANGNATNYGYDDDNRVSSQSNALNLTTRFTYDPVGNIATRVDANGKTTNYTYDPLNRLINTAYPDNTSVAIIYDAIGRKTSMTDATGQTSYIYDPLNRLLSKTSPGTNNVIIYTYDSEGNRLTSVDQNNRTINNIYDTLNRLVSVSDPNGVTTYNYDGVSNKISVASPNGVTERYTYDALNRVLSAVNASSSTVISSFTNVYDIAGMIIKKTLQDGSWTAYSYDALNRLLEETKQTSTAIIYDYGYTYDLVGNRLTWTKKTTLGGFWSTDSSNMPPQVLTNMTNGGYGNTASPTQIVTLARNYIYDAANRLSNWNYAVNIYSATFPIQTDTYTYDNNGNRLTKQAVLTGQEATPQQTAYGYDFENRLNQLNYVNIPNITGTQTDNLIYNGEGLRTQAVLNSVAANYLYDGSNVLVERDSSGNTTKSYTRGLDSGGGIGSLINQNYTANGTSVTQYYDYNDLGSTSDLTTTSGTPATNYTYDAFGNLLNPPASTDTNRYLFSTKEFDSRSGLSYFGSRYYDPEIGRWLTQDPLGVVDGPNMYTYVGNSPINFYDPYGLQEVPIQVTPPVNLGSPDLSDIVPDLSGVTPDVSDVQPDASGGFPDVSGGLPDIPGLPPFGMPGSPSLPEFSGAPDCGGKENAQDCASQGNGDLFSKEHDKNPTPSNREGHEKGQERKKRDKPGGEDGDKRRWGPGQKRRGPDSVPPGTQ